MQSISTQGGVGDKLLLLGERVEDELLVRRGGGRWLYQ